MNIVLFFLHTGAGASEEDELYERGVVESNCVYRLVDNRLVPHEQAWASIPSISLLGSTEVLVPSFFSFPQMYVSHILQNEHQEGFNSCSHLRFNLVCVSRPWCLISAVRCICGMDRMFPSGGEMLLSS